MTSPLPPEAPDAGAVQRYGLSPPGKIGIAAVILLIGVAVAAASIEVPKNADLLTSAPGEVSAMPPTVLPSASFVSKAPISKPVPTGDPEPHEVFPVAVAIPELTEKPDQASGREKYAQIFSPPEFVGEKSIHPPGEPEINVESNTSTTRREVQQFEPFPDIFPVEKNIVKKEFTEKPETMTSTEMQDALLPLYHFAENSKPETHRSDGTVFPEDPFHVFRPETDSGETSKPAEKSPGLELLPLRIVRSASEQKRKTETPPRETGTAETFRLLPLSVAREPEQGTQNAKQDLQPLRLYSPDQTGYR